VHGRTWVKKLATERLKLYNATMMVARYEVKLFNIIVVQTADKSKNDIKQFYTELTKTQADISKRDVLVTEGDWNAKASADSDGGD
jgi:hypothetical protein